MYQSSSRRLPWLVILAEGAMIIASILLAFAIDAWWDSRQDRAQEDIYLHMLAADLRETLEDNATYSGRADDIDWAGARLLRAYYEPDLPSQDSLGRWASLALGWWVVQPTLATARTLVTTGDLNLIRDDSIRAAVPEYLTAMTSYNEFQRQAAADWQETTDELADHVGLELARLRLSRTPVSVRDSLAAADDLYPFPGGRMRQLPSINPEALVRNDEVHQLLWRMNSAKGMLRTWRASMREHSERLLELVEAALAE